MSNVKLIWITPEAESTLKEKWLPVIGYEGLYEVSDQGRVRSIDRNLITKTGKNYIRKGKVLAFNINKVGLPYKRVKLSKDGNASLHQIGRAHV